MPGSGLVTGRVVLPAVEQTIAARSFGDPSAAQDAAGQPLGHLRDEELRCYVRPSRDTDPGMRSWRSRAGSRRATLVLDTAAYREKISRRLRVRLSARGDGTSTSPWAGRCRSTRRCDMHSAIPARSRPSRTSPARTRPSQQIAIRPLRDSRATVIPGKSPLNQALPAHRRRASVGDGHSRIQLNQAGFGAVKRRGRDLNPRRTQRPVTVFEICSLVMQTSMVRIRRSWRCASASSRLSLPRATRPALSRPV
jgi:hypothetical protein